MGTGTCFVEAMESRTLMSGVTPGAQFPLGPGHALAVDGDLQGDLVVVSSRPVPGQGDKQLYAQRFDRDGNALGGAVLVYDVSGGNFYQHVGSQRVAASGDGSFVIAWLSYNTLNDNADWLVRRFDAAGAPVTGAIRVASAKMHFPAGPTVGTDDQGDFMVCWPQVSKGTGADVVAQRFGPAGQLLGKPFRVNTTTAGNQGGPSVGMNGGGTSVVIWADDTRNDLYGQRFAANGSRIGGEFQVNQAPRATNYAGQVSIAADGNFVAAWQNADGAGEVDGDGVFFRQFTAGADGTLSAGAERRANDQTTGAQTRLSLDVARDGSFVLGWDDGQVTGPGPNDFVVYPYVQAYEADGTPVGGNVRATDVGAVGTYSPYSSLAVVAQSGTNAQSEREFVLAWQSSEDGPQPDTNPQIFGRKFIIDDLAI